MKTARPHTRDRHEDRSQREEKLGQAMDTWPGKTLRDRTPAAARRDIPRSKAERIGIETNIGSAKASAVPRAVVTAEAPAAHFSLFAPNAETVQVAGNFNGWDPAATPLKKETDGSWRVALDLERGAYEYRFIVDGNWRDDPMACDSVENPYGSRNSIKHVA